MTPEPELASIRSRLEAACARAPDLDALRAEDWRMSYAELLDRVDRMMGLLVRDGWRPGGVIGVAIRDPRTHLVTALSLLALGAPQVVLPSHETPASNRATMASLGVSLIVCDGREPWMGEVAAIVLAPGAFDTAPSGWGEAVSRPGEDAACYVKTSGSTNVPKLFALSFAKLLRAADRCGRDPRERIVMRTSPVEFDSTRLYRLQAFLGGRTGVMAPDDRSRIGEVCARFDVSQVHIGTYALGSLAFGDAPPAVLPAATNILTGGARVSGRLRQRVKERLTPNLSVSYATSEVGIISVATPDQHADFPEGVGFPWPTVEVEIVDPAGRPVAPGAIGEIRVRKPGDPQRYVGDAHNSDQFRDGWFYPNDLGSRAENRPIIYHGRSDDVMLLDGIKISSSAIEDALAACRGVREAVAFPLESRVHGQIPAAAVVLAPDAEGTRASDLLDQCRAALGVRAPRKIVILDAIPRTATGKPIKRELAGA